MEQASSPTGPALSICNPRIVALLLVVALASCRHGQPKPAADGKAPHALPSIGWQLK